MPIMPIFICPLCHGPCISPLHRRDEAGRIVENASNGKYRVGVAVAAANRGRLRLSMVGRVESEGVVRVASRVCGEYVFMGDDFTTCCGGCAGTRRPPCALLGPVLGPCDVTGRVLFAPVTFSAHSLLSPPPHPGRHADPRPWASPTSHGADVGHDLVFPHAAALCGCSGHGRFCHDDGCSFGPRPSQRPPPIPRVELPVAIATKVTAVVQAMITESSRFIEEGRPIPGAFKPTVPKRAACPIFKLKHGMPGQACHEIEGQSGDKRKRQPPRCRFYPCVAHGSGLETHFVGLFAADPEVQAWQASRMQA